MTTELKTLREIEDTVTFSGHDAMVLRSEAIKHVKELNHNRSSNQEYSKPELTGMVDWIMKFFNLTEKDLQ